MTETIDRDRAVELLRQQVEKNGADYVYRAARCVYFDAPGCPACIVGHVFADLGADMASVHEQGRRPGSEADKGNGISVIAVNVDGVTLTDGARRVLKAAQQAQDGGKTWGEALVAAEFTAHHTAAAGVL